MPDEHAHPYPHGVLHAMHYLAGLGVPWIYAIAIAIVIPMMAIANPSVDIQKDIIILWAFVSFFFIWSKGKQLVNHIDKQEVLSSLEGRKQAFACFAPLVGLFFVLLANAYGSIHYGFGAVLLILETLAATAVILGTYWPLIFDLIKASPIAERAELEPGNR